jgi:hypothetical protein
MACSNKGGRLGQGYEVPKRGTPDLLRVSGTAGYDVEFVFRLCQAQPIDPAKLASRILP